METTQDNIIYEHPLTEKMRTTLRLENLLRQLYEVQDITMLSQATAFFCAIADLLELIERSDIRTDLAKELERQQQKLSIWLGVKGVDMNRLNQTIAKLQEMINKLSSSPRIGSSLKEERLISCIRQRLNIPGGCCSFDVPILYAWLDLQASERQLHIQSWLNSLSMMNEAVSLILQLIRQSGIFRPFEYNGNFFQDTNESIELLRIRFTRQSKIYPQVSGNKARFAIRFMYYSKTDPFPVEKPHPFELACC